MVSLRSNWSALRPSAPVLGSVLLCVGALLLALHVAGMAWHNGSLRSQQDRSLRQYVADVRAGAPFDLEEATRRIYLGTMHSDDRRIAVTENWLQWTLGQVYAPLLRTQDAERLLAGKLANCSERSQILKHLAEGAGYPCRFVGLDGHVVLEVQTQQAWRVADPDYGVVYPVGIALLQEAEMQPLICRMLSSLDHSPPIIERYLDIVQSAENNVVLPVGSALSPRLAVIERACQWLVWGIPIGCVLLGAGLRLGRLRQTKRARRPQLPDQPGHLSQAAS